MRYALAACACALACACAKAPDASTNPKASAESSAQGTSDAASSLDASSPDSGRAFGLPMPQQYPHFVWDAAAADARDATTPPLTR